MYWYRQRRKDVQTCTEHCITLPIGDCESAWCAATNCGWKLSTLLDISSNTNNRMYEGIYPDYIVSLENCQNSKTITPRVRCNLSGYSNTLDIRSGILTIGSWSTRHSIWKIKFRATASINKSCRDSNSGLFHRWRASKCEFLFWELWNGEINSKTCCSAGARFSLFFRNSHRVETIVLGVVVQNQSPLRLYFSFNLRTRARHCCNTSIVHYLDDTIHVSAGAKGTSSSIGSRSRTACRHSRSSHRIERWEPRWGT